MLKRTLGFTGALLICSLLIGCGSPNDLSRKQAANLLLENLDYPKERTAKLVIGDTRALHLCEYERKDQLFAINGTGLGTAQRGAGTYGGKEYCIFKLDLSDEGLKYLRSGNPDHSGTPYAKVQVLSRTEVFGEVTGIVFNDSKTAASVEFSVISEPSPFAVLMGQEETNKLFTRSANLRLYDDGWRFVK